MLLNQNKTTRLTLVSFLYAKYNDVVSGSCLAYLSLS